MLVKGVLYRLPKSTLEFTSSVLPLPWVTDRLPLNRCRLQEGGVGQVGEIHTKIDLIVVAVALAYGHVAVDGTPPNSTKSVPLPSDTDALPCIVLKP